MKPEFNLKEALSDLGKRMEQGKIVFDDDDGELAKELLAVKQDSNGNPLPETVGPRVRAILLSLHGTKLDEKS